MTDHNKTSRQYLIQTIDEDQTKSKKLRFRYGIANNTSTVLVIILSAVTAVLTQADLSHSNYFLAKNMVTIISLLVAIISSVQSKFGFERRWAANRVRYSSLKQLKIDEKMGVDDIRIAEAIKTIIAAYNDTITSGSVAPPLLSRTSGERIDPTHGATR